MDDASMSFMKNAHVIPEPPYAFPMVSNPAPTFGRRFERLFPEQPCYYCGGVPNSVDHMVPRSKGGSDGCENLVPCCFRCNQMKSNMTVEEFVVHLRLVLETLARKKVIQAGKDIFQCPIAA
jgi:hypothetical protein